MPDSLEDDALCAKGLAVLEDHLGPVQALPNLWALALLGATVSALVVWHIGAVKLMCGGAIIGVLRSRLAVLRGVKTALPISLWAKV
jgi:hypothetical protein